MHVDLTKEADTLICLLYRQYIERRKEGISMEKARQFGDAENIHKNYVPQWDFQDIDKRCRELYHAGLFIFYSDNNIPYRVELSEKAIIDIEKRFGDDISNISNYIKEIEG